MEINLQESSDWFKLMNEIPNIKGNIILCEKCLFCINFIFLYRAFRISDIGQGTNNTPFRSSVSQ